MTDDKTNLSATAEGTSAEDARPADKNGPNVKFPPPVMFVVVMLVSYLLEGTVLKVLLEGLITGSEMLYYIGGMLVLLALVIIAIAALTFKKAQTNIEPWKPSEGIIQHGIFKYSRNPIYIAFAVIQIGIGIMLSSVLILFTTPISLFSVYIFVIKKEEAYLENKFGNEYRQYKSHVRRWL